MIRVARALAWLRWREIVNGVRRSARRGGTERLAQALMVATWLGLSVILVPVIAGSAIGGVAIGSALGGGDDALAHGAALIVRIVVLALLGLLLVAPFLRASAGGSSDSTRLRLIPVPHAVLHAASLVAGLTDPWLVAMLPLFVAVPLALAWKAHLLQAAVAGIAGLLLLVVMLAAGSLSGTVTELLVRDRRRGEAVTLVLLLALTFAGLVPILLMGHGPDAENEEHEPLSVRRVASGEERLPGWLEALPSGQYAQSLMQARDRHPARVALHLMALAGTAALLTTLSSAAHRRLLQEPPKGASRGATRSAGRLAPRQLRSPVGSVALASVREILRTVRGKIVLFTPGIMVAAFALLHRQLAELTGGGPTLGTQGATLFYVGLGLCVFNVGGLMVNQFAMDGGGLTRHLLSPLSDQDIVRGKEAGAGLVLALAAVPCFVVAALMGTHATAFRWIEAPVDAAAAWLTMAPLAAVLSCLLPKAPGRTRPSTGSGVHVAAAVIGAAAMLILLAVGPALSGVDVLLHRPRLGLALSLGWLALAAGVHAWGMPLAAEVLGRERERVGLAAQQR